MIERLAKFLQTRGVSFETFGAVFDIGSRDGLQALELAKQFPRADIIAIECNPATIEICRRNTSQNARIKLIDKAINSFTGRCDFYPIDPMRTVTTWKDGNPGASSLFIATADYPVETYVQTKTEVDCMRLDDLCGQLGIDVIDLIWMDLQGAELLALQSAGEFLDRVRYIYTEVSHRSIYKGQCLFDDVDALLTARGFRRCTRVDRSRWQQDIIYENTRELIDLFIPLDAVGMDTIDLSVRSAREHVKNVRHLFLVGSERVDIPGSRFIDEKRFPFDVNSLSRALGSGEHAAGLVQQLIKLYFPLVIGESLEHVLAVDGGTIFLNSFACLQDGRPVFDIGDDYSAANFDHMSRLLPSLIRMIAYSGITHCLLYKRAWLNELHQLILEAHGGLPVWMSYSEAVERGTTELGASDAEIYFNFALKFHPRDLTIRALRWRDIAEFEEIDPRAQDYIRLCGGTKLGQADRKRLEAMAFSNREL